MFGFSKKHIIIFILILIVLGIGMFVWFARDRLPEEVPVEVVEPEIIETQHRVIGSSVEGRSIEAYTYGDGDVHLLFVGGIHGGYEWNSVLLAYEFMDYLDLNANAIPSNIRVSVIPSLNPDGVVKVIGTEGRFALSDTPPDREATAPGRFNANDVDLNRNFDCQWQPESTWRGNVVSAGTEPFSEPEAKALRDFVLGTNPDAVVFFHSKANNVYASECEEGVLPETLDIMNAYANASGYGAVESFDAYPITGDAEGWLASINIPALTVELETYNEIEWEQNLAGVKALFEYYGI